MLVILILGKEIEGIKLNLIIAMTVVILSEFASRDVIEQASNFDYHFPFLFCVAQKKIMNANKKMQISIMPIRCLVLILEPGLPLKCRLSYVFCKKIYQTANSSPPPTLKALMELFFIMYPS